MSVQISEELAMTVYKVEYEAVQGNGYDTCSYFRTFGVYERREVAEAVRKGIEDGSIQPVRKA